MNFNRISGFASGMDTESIIKDMMTVNRMPLDKLFMKKQTYTWQRDQYRDMNKLLKDLDTTTFDTIGLQSTFLGKKVSSTDESAVTATGAGAAGNVNSTVEVSQLAESAQWKGKVDVKQGGAEISKLPGGSDLFTNPPTDEEKKDGIAIEFEVTKPGSEKAEKVTFNIKPDDTLEGVLKKINDSNAGLSAMYSSSTGELALTSKETGAGVGINFKEDSNAQKLLKNALKLDVKLDRDSSGDIINKRGKDARFKIDGVSFQEKSSIATVGGMKYTFKKVTTEPVRITSEPDVDKSFEAVKKWVDKYNETIKTINDKTTEKKNRDYQPLTDEQKKDMSEDQIKKWEEKASAGLLRGDAVLTGALNSMRTTMASDPVRLKQLEKMGITFSKNYLDKGKLEINEEKLKTALGKDPNAVYEAFNGSGDNKENSIVKQVRGTLSNAMKGVEEKAGNSIQANHQFTIGRNIEDIEKSMKKMEAKLKMVESRLWREFGAMEQAINNANNQGAALMNSFGG